MDLKQIIRTIPDFPEAGILFRDITPILQNADYLKEALDQFTEKLEGINFDKVVGPESRGFIFGVPLACNLHKGFIPVRKAGKLPFNVVSKSYSLEYGNATIEMHTDAISKGENIVIIDDLLATGGTCKAMVELIEEMGANVVAIVFLIELEALGGRNVLAGYNVQSIMKY